MATYYERQRVLMEEFKALDRNHDSLLTREELYGCLDTKLGRTFDREIGEQLWAKACDGGRDTVAVERIVDVVIQAEDALKSKIDICRSLLADNYKQRRDSELKLQELQLTERLNIYGVMDGSQCTIAVSEAMNLRFADLSQVLDPFVVVRVDKQEFQTKVAKGANPQWPHESFPFTIQTGREDIVVTVCDFDKFTNNVVIGRVNINLQNNNLGIRDQTKHELWLDLYDQMGSLTGSQLHLTVQWIYSRVRYLTDVLNSFKVQIAEQEEELTDYEHDLNCLYEPFLKWQYLYKGIGTTYIQMPSPLKIQNLVSPKNRKRPFYDPRLEPQDLFQALKIVISVFLLLVVFQCFERCVFLDIVIICDFVILYEWNALNENKLVSLAVLLGFSTFLDIPWLMMFFRVVNFHQQFQEWMNPINANIYVDSSSQRFVALTALFCFFVKLGICVTFILLSNKLKQQNGSYKPTSPRLDILRMDLQGSQALTNSKVFLTKGKAVEIY